MISLVGLQSGVIRFANCIHQNHIFRSRPYLSEMQSEWLMFSANSEHGRTYFTTRAKQSTNLASINLTQLRSFPVPLPPPAEQIRIIDEIQLRFSVLDETCESLDKNLGRAHRLRQAILKMAYEGRLVPQVQNDEPADALLSRIQAERKARKEASAVESKARKQTQKETPVAAITGQRQSLYQALLEADVVLLPERLFDKAGFTVPLVDEFYEELRREVPAGSR